MNSDPITIKPRVWTVFAAWFLAALLGEIAILAAVVTARLGLLLVMKVQGAGDAAIHAHTQELFQQPLLGLAVTLLPYQLAMGFVVLLAALASPEPLTQRVGLTPPARRKIGRFSLVTMAGFTLSLALGAVVGSTLLFAEPPSSSTGAAAASPAWWNVVLCGLILTVLPALVEEIVFRGYIQRRLLERWSPAVAIGVSTLLFAILHADSLQHIVAVVPLGLVTGLLAYRTKSVKAGMILHAIHNAGAVGFAALIRGLTPLIGEEAIGMLTLGVLAAAFLLGLPAVVSLLWTRKSEPAPVAAPVIPHPAIDLLASHVV